MLILRFVYFLLLATLLFFVLACQTVKTNQDQQSDITAQSTAAPSTIPPTNSATNKPAWIADGIISTGEYMSSKTYGEYQISWLSDDSYIYIGLKAKTTGWVAVGFGAGPMMKNADIIQGYAADGKAEVIDMFSTGEFGPHPPDTQLGGNSDIIESAAQTVSGFTTVEFKRKLDTGDRYDKALVKGISKIIWAYGSEPRSTLKHIVRGAGEIEIK